MTETTALGAAYLAGLGVGLYPRSIDRPRLALRAALRAAWATERERSRRLVDAIRLLARAGSAAGLTRARRARNWTTG